ncbi:MAG TPA: MFS transporter [Chloroflexota bacterium]
MRDLLSVLRTRNLALLLSGRIVSTMGDWLYTVALSVAIFQYSGGNSLAIGALWIVRLIPSLLLGPAAGALTDRMGYRRAMIVGDAGRAVIVVVLALTLHAATWPVIYPLAFLFTCFGNLFAPASVGIVPRLVDSSAQRLAANAAIMEVESLAMVVGSALGGVIAAQGHITQLLLIEAATFGVSILTLWLVRERPAVAVDTGPEEAEEERIGILAGLRLLSLRPLLVFAALVMALPELASGADVVWIVPYSENILHLGNGGIGYLYSALSVGCLVGGLATAAIGGTIRLEALLAIGVAVGGAALALFGTWHVAVAALFFIFVVGLAETLEYAAYETLLQQAVPETMIGQASGSMESLFSNMMIAGTVLSGPLATWPGVTPSLAGLGSLTILAAGGGWWYLRRQTAGRFQPDLLSRIPAFAHVSEEVRDWAVRRMLRERFPRGSIIIRQGDEGDKFYTIASGMVQVEVAANGRTETTKLGPGEFFGEIALLQHIPRTATVRALESVTVYSMTRDDFEDLQARSGELEQSLLETSAARLEGNSAHAPAVAARA